MAGPDVRTGEDRGDVIGWGPIVFIPLDEEQAVMLAGPLGIATDVALEPLISSANASAVHVVIDVGNHKGDSRQIREIPETGEGAIISGGNIGEIHPGIMMTDILAHIVAGVTPMRQAFAVAGETVARGDELPAKARRGKG